MNEPEEKDKDKDKDKCQSYKCNSPGRELHTCPYAEEIGGDSESLCNCCEHCEYQCAMDI